MGAANELVFPEVGLTFEKLSKGIEEEFGVGNVWFKEASTLTPDPADLDDWRKCIFLLNQPNQTVLMDKERRIRGFYDLRLRDEVDRLRVELKILLKKY